MIKKGETYIIGEIGQNHNGSVDIAKLIVEFKSHSPKVLCQRLNLSLSSPGYPR